MAEPGSQVYRDKFCCSVCLDLLKDPVTPACGHSYCRSCITDHWNSEEGRGAYSCPQCRETFTPRPQLRKNIVLAELVEELKETGLQAAPADHSYAGPEDVACDVCPGRKLKARKSCLVCVASYCENHLRPHYDAAPLKKHQLVEPSEKLQENICPLWEEVDEMRLQILKRIQDKEGDVKLLQQETEVIRGSAQRAVDHSQKIFAQLIGDLQQRSSEVKRQIGSRQETEERRVKELQEKLEQEIRDLKRRDAELERLANTRDHQKFLQDFTSLSTLPSSTHPFCTTPRSLRHFEDLTAAMSKVGGQIQQLLTEASTDISWTVADVDVLLNQPGPEPESRANFLRCSKGIKVDPNTVNKFLILSEGKRKVTCVEEVQSYSDHPDRFTVWPQVLSRERLTGQRYWEVEVRGRVRVAVSYKNISRAGDLNGCGFGFNDKSWSLNCLNNSYNFYHHNIKTALSGPVSSRLGVYLDHRAGVLAFYSVSDTMTLIHRVQTTFTQPLHAGIGLYSGSSAEFCELK